MGLQRNWTEKVHSRKKKKELNEYEDLVSSGYIDEINNKKRIRLDLEYLEEDV